MAFVLSPICFLRQYSDCIEIYANSVRHGHDFLSWYKKGSTDVRFVPLQSGKIKLDGFDVEGYYVFSTLNFASGEQSAEMEFYFLCETPEDRINRLFNLIAESPDEKALDLAREKVLEKLKDNESRYISELVYESLSELESPQDPEIETFFRIGLLAERQENIMALVGNRNFYNECSISYSGNIELSLDGMFSKIVLCEHNGKNYVPVTSDSVLGKYSYVFRANPNRFYEIQLWEESGLSCQFHHVQYDETIQLLAWDEKINANYAVSQLAVSAYISDADVDMDEQELEWYIEDTNLSTQYSVLPRVSIEEAGDNVVKVTVPDYSLLQVLRNRFHIGIKEQDMIMLDYLDRYAEINAEKIRVDCKKSLIDGNCVFYVKDSNGVPLSRYQRYDFTYSISDYQEKMHHIDIHEYEKRIIPILKSIDPDVKDVLSSSIQAMKEDMDVPVEHAPLKLASDILASKSQKKMDLLYAIFSDRETNMFVLDKDFFNDSLTYYRSSEQFAVPDTENGHALVINVFDSAGTLKRNFYPNIQGASIDFSIKLPRIYYFYCIDRLTYRRSGFILVNSIERIPAIKMSNVSLEVE